tara:strand:- start:4016 stop:4693 length:678 start_codon:yes stop_codon:yes gene_type:complete
MLVNEIIKRVEEGPNDPNIFKAVFLAGGPGSGKSFVAGKMLKGTGLKSVNSDEVYEYLADKENFDLSDPDKVASDQGQEMRNRAKALTSTREKLYLDGRLGLIIDGTGREVTKVSDMNTKLQALGYDTMMLFVNTSEDVALDRNKQRKRSIPSEMVTKMWHDVQQNIMKFQQIFGASNFHIVDNSGGLEDPDRKQNFDKVYKNIQNFISTKPTRPLAKRWLLANI